MRVVLAFLATEVALGVAPAAARRGRFAAVLRHKALHAGPGLDQRAVNREMVAGQKLAKLRQVQHAGKELGRDIAIEQAIPVLAEYRGIPDRIVRRQSDEPAEQQIIVELLHQLPFRAHRVERLQQQRPQQSLRRDRRSAVARVQLVELPRQTRQHRVGQRADSPQRMIRRYPPLYRDVAEKTLRPLVFAAHRNPRSKGITHMHRITLPPSRKMPFSAACSHVRIQGRARSFLSAAAVSADRCTRTQQETGPEDAG